MLERVQVTEIAQIYDLWHAYAAAFNNSDLEKLVSMWVEGGRHLLPGCPDRVGKNTIREWMQHLFDQFIIEQMTIQTEEIRVLGNQAYAYGSYKVNLTPREGGEMWTCSGKFLNILEKQVDGSWKFAIDCHNYTPPLGHDFWMI